MWDVGHFPELITTGEPWCWPLHLEGNGAVNVRGHCLVTQEDFTTEKDWKWDIVSLDCLVQWQKKKEKKRILSITLTDTKCHRVWLNNKQIITKLTKIHLYKGNLNKIFFTLSECLWLWLHLCLAESVCQSKTTVVYTPSISNTTVSGITMWCDTSITTWTHFHLIYSWSELQTNIN